MQPPTRHVTPADAERLIRAGQADAQRWRPRLVQDSSEFAVADAAALDAPALADALSLAGYHVTGNVRRGGQGVVLEAIQQSTQRTVAIKVFHSRGDTGHASLRRFEREASLLTELRHPNIVTVYDVGVAGDIRYLIMDFVDGRPIDEYVAAAGLALRDALKLFVTVCDAVNAAHLKGVIHRDLKPANILVREDGACAEPMVLDFGLAKRAAGFKEVGWASPTSLSGGQSPSDMVGDAHPTSAGTGIPSGSSFAADTLTHAGQFVGSLPWSSPEQAAGDQAKIDIRTDVYSLGVILYQLLTGGRFPYDVTGPMRDVLNRIVTTEPARPRAAVSSFLNPSLPQSLNPFFVDDEVETIVLKCLAKDPTRRYQSAGDLAADIRRYLASEAIEAKRDSRIYVLRKTLRRYRGSIAIASLFLLLGWGVIFALWRHAEQGRQTAEAQTAIAREFMTTLSSFIEQTDPRDDARTPNAIKRLREFAAQLPIRLANQPEAESEFRSRIAIAFHKLGRDQEADEQFTAALRVARLAFGDDDERVASLLSAYGYCSPAPETRDRAMRFATEALRIRRRLYGDGDPRVCESLINCAGTMYAVGEIAAGDAYLHDALQTPGATHGYLAGSMKSVAEYLFELGRFDEALPLQQRALDWARQAADESGDLSTLDDHLHSFAVLQRAMNRLDKAEELQRECLEIRETVYPPGSRYRFFVYVTKESLAYTLVLKGRDFAEAETLLLDARQNFDPWQDDKDTRAIEREIVERLVFLYEKWHSAEPDETRAQEANKWRGVLSEMNKPPP